MNSIDTILAPFKTISLEQTNGSSLMDRFDVKYLFPKDKLVMYLNELKNDYKILEVNHAKINSYETLYFDTPKLALYYAHHQGKLNRYKIRYRKYIESNDLFFEIKIKNNKGRTIKRRIQQTEMSKIFSKEAKIFIQQNTTLDPQLLEEKIWINNSRITLISNDDKERITFDFDISLTDNNQTKTIEKIVIAEVKQGKLFHSSFINLMKKHRVRSMPISKYCIGTIYLQNAIKHNNFKPLLNSLNKLQHAIIA